MKLISKNKPNTTKNTSLFEKKIFFGKIKKFSKGKYRYIILLITFNKGLIIKKENIIEDRTIK